MNKVTIYTTPTCAYCKAVKEYFRTNNVEYSEIDVAANQKAGEEMVKKSGQLGVPVIIIEKNGIEEIIVGFDQAKLSNLLGIKN